jgi:hypothetical protein
MKRIAIALFVLVSLCLQSCAENKTINGTTYRPYGILNEGSQRNPEIYYEISGWAVFSGIVFSECLFIPTIYTFGYNLYEPISTMQEFKNKRDAGKVK